MPLELAGLARCSASSRAARFSFRSSTLNEARPIVQCTMPPLSVRYCTWPALAFFTASVTLGVTVPTLGFGIRPRGPRIWPSAPTTRMASGVAMTTSKSILPALTSAARSSKPTMSAPASLALVALSPWANTATRTVLPVPRGSTTEPRTSWSDLRASMPRLTATSMDSSNLAVAVCLTRLSASVSGYTLLRSTLALIALVRLEMLAMLYALHFNTHAAGAAGDGTHGCIHVGSSQVRHFCLGDIFGLGAGQLADLVGMRTRAAFLHAGGFLDQHGGGRGLHHEGEALVRIGGNHHRN